MVHRDGSGLQVFRTNQDLGGFETLEQKCKERSLLLPLCDEILAQIASATIFSKLDANSGFWQILLARESCLLTTFITRFKHFQFNNYSLESQVQHNYFKGEWQRFYRACKG